ncbi:MAG: hypothetical protein H6765_00445 [Candidatus Peribacteria bacterium]|nr:MAG: hypothetical protein H6765_00445 [Candidatus Peribacteria bacterium]
MELASYFDHTIIFEKAVTQLQELNCSVLEKDGAILTTLVEEAASNASFLNFHEKYTSES